MWQSWDCPERCTTSEHSIDAKPFTCCLKVFSFSLKLWNPVVTPQKPFNTWPQNSWIPCLKLNWKMWHVNLSWEPSLPLGKTFPHLRNVACSAVFQSETLFALGWVILDFTPVPFWNLQWSSFHKEGPSHARPFKVKHSWIAISATTLCQPAFLSNSVQLPVQRHGFHCPTSHLHVWWHVLA